VYGGTIASIIDCHSAFTALEHAYREAGRPFGSEPVLWYVTGSLRVDYLAPTPLGPPLELRARVTEVKGRKRVVVTSLRAGDQECARGEAIMIAVPSAWRDPAAAPPTR
jgi:acyl-CoA thioesterase FadM